MQLADRLAETVIPPAVQNGRQFSRAKALYRRWMEQARDAGPPSGVFFKEAVQGFYRLGMYSDAVAWLPRLQALPGSGEDIIRQRQGMQAGFIDYRRFPELYQTAVGLYARWHGTGALPLLRREVRIAGNLRMVHALAAALGSIRSAEILPLLQQLFKKSALAASGPILAAAGSAGRAGAEWLSGFPLAVTDDAKLRLAVMSGLAGSGSAAGLRRLSGMLHRYPVRQADVKRLAGAIFAGSEGRGEADRILRTLLQRFPALGGEIAAARSRNNLPGGGQATASMLVSARAKVRSAGVRLAGAGPELYWKLRAQLLQLAFKERDPGVVHAYTELFSARKEPDAVAGAVRLLERGADLQTEALWTVFLGDMRASEAVPVLRNRYLNGAPGLRVLAGKALERITGKPHPVKLQQ